MVWVHEPTSFEWPEKTNVAYHFIGRLFLVGFLIHGTLKLRKRQKEKITLNADSITCTPTVAHLSFSFLLAFNDYSNGKCTTYGFISYYDCPFVVLPVADKNKSWIRYLLLSLWNTNINGTPLTWHDTRKLCNGWNNSYNSEVHQTYRTSTSGFCLFRCL